MTPNRRISAALSAPLLVLLGVAVAAPMATFFVYSFFTFEMRKAHPGFDLGSYGTALGDATYRVFAWNTLALAIPTTIASVVAGFALAYYIAFAAGKFRNTLLALVVFSMLGSYLVRIYAWRTLMGENGVINSTLETLRMIDEPLHFLLFSRFAVIVGLTNLFVPFTTLLIYASLSGIPDGLLSASRDLGAGRARDASPDHVAARWPGRPRSVGVDVLSGGRGLHHARAPRRDELRDIWHCHLRPVATHG